MAFRYAVYKINKDKIILPKTTLVYDVQYVPKDDSFHASKKGKYFHHIIINDPECLHNLYNKFCFHFWLNTHTYNTYII